MSQFTDAEIVAALRHAVAEPPEVPSRVADVHRRARTHRRVQASAAALTAVAVVATGTVVLRANQHHAAAPATTAPVVPMTGIPASLYRPLHLPIVVPGAPCPISPSHTFPSGQGFSGAYSGVGDGPFALTGNGKVEVNFNPPPDERFFTDGHPGTKVIWRISDSYAGPVLVRGGRLDGTGTVEFDRYLGAADNGSTPGTAFPTLGYITTAGLGPTSYPSGIAVQSPGCYGIQVDGTNFSEVITFAVIPGHD